MAGAVGRSTGIQIKWHYVTGNKIPSDGTWANWFGAGKVVDGVTNELKYATGQPEVGAEPASGTEAVFGEDRKFEFTLPGDPATFELETQYDDGDAIHSAINSAEGGTDRAIAAILTIGAGQTIFGITGELKATKLRLDAEGLTHMTIPVAVDQIYRIAKP